MEKIERRTPDLTDELVDRLAELMPDIVTEDLDAEGNVVRSIDFDTLRENLTGSVADGRRERYQFTWPGKAKARLEARTPTAKTMRPARDVRGQGQAHLHRPALQHGPRLHLRRRLRRDARRVRRLERRVRRGGRAPGRKPRVQRPLPLRLVLDDVPEAAAGARPALARRCDLHLDRRRGGSQSSEGMRGGVRRHRKSCLGKEVHACK